MASQGSLSSAEGLIRSVVAPASITSAVLYYFGWLRSQTIAQDLGYDATLLGYGPQDYILRSVQPVATLAVVGATSWWVLLLGHRFIIGQIQKHRSERIRWRLPAFAALALGTLLIVDALDAAREGFDTADWHLALNFAAAAALLGYGSWLERFATRPMYAPVQVPQPIVWIVMALVAAGAFTATSWYAQDVGHQQARDNIRLARESAVATLTSTDPLDLEGVPSYTQGDHYITTGLVLLFSAGGRHFLVPVDYDQGTKAKVYTVDATVVRVDFDRSISVPCAGFDDLAVGSRYEIGDVIMSGGVRYAVQAGPTAESLDSGPPLPVGTGGPKGATVEAAGGFGQSVVIHLHQASLAPEHDAPYLQWTVRYRQQSDGVRAEINGASGSADKMTQLPRDPRLRRGGAVSVEGGTDGRVQIQARAGDSLRRMALGGTDLMLDCDADS
ncbi:MAG: hypothetical protein R2761_06525 [Acidimicrobiales bacterium]